jgi:hypothetical protein
MGQDIVVPLNSIIASNEGLIIEEFRVGTGATAAKMLPGTWVITDTLDGDIKQAGAKATNVLGILIEKSDGLITTAYAVGDRAHVVTGGNGCVLARVIAGGGNITVGTPIVTRTDGTCGIQLVGAQGSQGSIVALGEEIHANNGGAETNAVVRVYRAVTDAGT